MATFESQQVTIYVLDTRTGEVRSGVAFTLPVAPNGREQRWYDPGGSTVRSNTYQRGDEIAYGTLGEAVHAVEGWCSKKRKQIAEAYSWLSANAGTKP